MTFEFNIIIIANVAEPANAIPSSIGNRVSLCIAPTNADSEAPHTICKKPINAEALPAVFLKGANAIAVALGTNNPKQNRKLNINVIKIPKVINLNPYKATINIATMNRIPEAAVIIWSDEYLFKSNRLN